MDIVNGGNKLKILDNTYEDREQMSECLFCYWLTLVVVDKGSLKRLVGYRLLSYIGFRFIC